MSSLKLFKSAIAWLRRQRWRQRPYDFFVSVCQLPGARGVRAESFILDGCGDAICAKIVDHLELVICYGLDQKGVAAAVIMLATFGHHFKRRGGVGDERL